MILNYDHSKPLYILGDGISAQKIKKYIQAETAGDVICLNHTNFNNLQDGDYCIPGFYNFRESLKIVIDKKSLSWVTYIHDKAFVDTTSTIGKGVVLMPTSFVDYKATIGDYCLLSPGAMVGHGASLGNNGVLCPKTHIGGSTHVGNNFRLGQSATVADRLTICNDVTCVMSSVVTKNITKPGIYYGNRTKL